jgi:ankyrin repeat protein
MFSPSSENQGCDVNAANDENQTALSMAVEANDSALVQELLALGANPRASSVAAASPRNILASPIGWSF